MTTDQRSLLTEKLRKFLESKEVQFPGRGAPKKINRDGLFAVARDSSKISALVPQEHQIRMRSNERDKMRL